GVGFDLPELALEALTPAWPGFWHAGRLANCPAVGVNLIRARQPIVPRVFDARGARKQRLPHRGRAGMPETIPTLVFPASSRSQTSLALRKAWIVARYSLWRSVPGMPTSLPAGRGFSPDRPGSQALPGLQSSLPGECPRS